MLHSLLASQIMGFAFRVVHKTCSQAAREDAQSASYTDADQALEIEEVRRTAEDQVITHTTRILQLTPTVVPNFYSNNLCLLCWGGDMSAVLVWRHIN